MPSSRRQNRINLNFTMSVDEVRERISHSLQPEVEENPRVLKTCRVCELALEEDLFPFTYAEGTTFGDRTTTRELTICSAACDFNLRQHPTEFLSMFGFGRDLVTYLESAIEGWLDWHADEGNIIPTPDRFFTDDYSDAFTQFDQVYREARRRWAEAQVAMYPDRYLGFMQSSPRSIWSTTAGSGSYGIDVAPMDPVAACLSQVPADNSDLTPIFMSRCLDILYEERS